MVNNYLDGIEPIGLWKSDYVIHCDCRERASILGVRYRYHGGLCGVHVDLVSLASGASSDKPPYEGPHFWPNIVSLDQLDVSCLPWVSHYHRIVV